MYVYVIWCYRCVYICYLYKRMYMLYNVIGVCIYIICINVCMLYDVIGECVYICINACVCYMML